MQMTPSFLLLLPPQCAHTHTHGPNGQKSSHRMVMTLNSLPPLPRTDKEGNSWGKRVQRHLGSNLQMVALGGPGRGR